MLPLTQQLRARQSQSPEAGWSIERCVGGRRDVFSDEQIAESWRYLRVREFTVEIGLSLTCIILVCRLLFVRGTCLVHSLVFDSIRPYNFVFPFSSFVCILFPFFCCPQ